MTLSGKESGDVLAEPRIPVEGKMELGVLLDWENKTEISVPLVCEKRSYQQKYRYIDQFISHDRHCLLLMQYIFSDTTAAKLRVVCLWPVNLTIVRLPAHTRPSRPYRSHIPVPPVP